MQAANCRWRRFKKTKFGEGPRPAKAAAGKITKSTTTSSHNSPIKRELDIFGNEEEEEEEEVVRRTPKRKTKEKVVKYQILSEDEDEQEEEDEDQEDWSKNEEMEMENENDGEEA